MCFSLSLCVCVSVCVISKRYLKNYLSEFNFKQP